LEELVYNDDGQPLAGTLMDYLLPTSMEVPDFEIAMLDLAPSPRNPLGVKGAGEIGIVATGDAVSNALGVQVRELPLSPNKIRDLIGRSLEP
jgi:carbon-monoxide dehydrogenase large subunit